MNSHANSAVDDQLNPNINGAPHHPTGELSAKPYHAMNHINTPTQPNSLRQTCADINERVERFLSAPAKDEVTRRTQEQTRVAINVIAQALQDFDFEALSLSYNGGKDCLVLLILYLSVLHTHFTQPSGRRKQDNPHKTASTVPGEQDEDDDFPTTIPSIYAKPPDPFDSVTTFVESSTQAYHLSLTHISTNPGPAPKSNSHSSPPQTSPAHLATAEARLNNGSTPTTQPNPEANTTTSNSTTDVSQPIITFRDAFALYLDTHPSIKAIFVGTRRTDPHGATLKHFQMTDGNWPRFMRIHPVIDWRLSEIWCFLRSEYLADPRTGERLEYCTMYDEGYTSLGGVGDTVKNPRLRYVHADNNEGYRPAYEMTEDGDERAGRE